MGTDIYAGPLGETRAASTASGGTVLGTTAVLIPLPKGTKHLFITPRNFATAVVAKLAFNPWLVVLKTTDNLATVPTDYSESAQDGSTSTTILLNDFSTLAAGDFLLIGSHLPFRGVAIDVEAANGGAASALTVAYWDAVTWTSISATDGTVASSKTMAVDGNVTWTVPTGWKAESLRNIFANVGPSVSDSVLNSPRMAAYSVEKMYWTRWVVSVVLDDAVTLNSMLALNRSTAYGEFITSLVHERRVHRGLGGIGCIEALTDAGTANLIVTVDSGNGGRFV